MFYFFPIIPNLCFFCKCNFIWHDFFFKLGICLCLHIDNSLKIFQWDNHFTSKINKIFKRQTVKIRCSCKENIEQIIKNTVMKINKLKTKHNYPKIISTTGKLYKNKYIKQRWKYCKTKKKQKQNWGGEKKKKKKNWNISWGRKGTIGGIEKD